MSKIVVLLFSFSLSFSFSQNEGNIWYFGTNAGLDFNGGTPVPLTNSAMSTVEGCSSISDNNGNILFYTDGTTVYNANHVAMPNGTALSGNSSSTQSAIIVQDPGNPVLYYVFTVSAFGTTGLNYSVVDMTLQAGLGDVTVLNSPIVSNTTEKVTAVKHANGVDFWIITLLSPGAPTSGFHSYQLSPAGVNLTPVVSNLGQPNNIGYLRSNLQGDRIAVANAYGGGDEVQLYDFDDNTGLLSNELSFSRTAAYGVEFSPNGNLLYVSCENSTNTLYQYNLQAGTGTITDIVNSEVNLSDLNSTSAGGALQLGPDLKIYHSRVTLSTLGVISDPDILGVGCNYNSTGQTLGTQTTLLGLPTFFNSIYNQSSTSNLNICAGDSVLLYNSGFQNHNWSLANTPTVIFSNDTAIHVSPNNNTNYLLVDGQDTAFFNVTVNPVPSVNLGPDVNFCNQTSVVLKDPALVGDPALTFSWQDGSTADTLIAFTTGQYFLTVSNGFCSNSDTIIVSNVTGVDINANNPNCFATPTGSIIANVNNNPNPVTFVISDVNGNIVNTPGTNAANNLLAGLYYVEYADGTGCVGVDSVVLVDPPLILPTITTVDPLCSGMATGSATVSNIINYQGSVDSIFYAWTPNPSGNNGLNVTSIGGLWAGTYSLEVIDNFGCVNDVIFNIVDPDPLVGEVTSNLPTYCRTAGFQSGNGLVAAQTVPDSSGTGSVNYQWLHLGTGQSAISSTFVVRAPGQVQLTITDANGCEYIEVVQVDSINPMADFVVDSPQFLNPDIYEGTEDVNVKITNLSTNFAQANNPNSDTIFLWNLYTNQLPTSNQNWFFSYDVDEKVDTTYGGEETYNICLIAKNFNDCQDTICKDVTVFSFPDLMTPNVFTPGSEPNNTFYFPAKGIGEFNCKVLNRYGVQVYEFTDIADQWDGNHYKSGNPCSDGVYFYVYDAESTNGTSFQGEGQVTLIRAK